MGPAPCSHTACTSNPCSSTYGGCLYRWRRRMLNAYLTDQCCCVCNVMQAHEVAAQRSTQRQLQWARHEGLACAAARHSDAGHWGPSARRGSPSRRAGQSSLLAIHRPTRPTGSGRTATWPVQRWCRHGDLPVHGGHQVLEVSSTSTQATAALKQ